jgi:hypothetical protein
VAADQETVKLFEVTEEKLGVPGAAGMVRTAALPLD